MTQGNQSLIPAGVAILSFVFVTLIVFAPLFIIWRLFERTEPTVILLAIAAALSFIVMLLFLFGPFQVSRRMFIGLSGTNSVGAVVIIGIAAVVDYIDTGYATVAVAVFIVSALISLLALALPERCYEGRVGGTLAAVSLSYTADSLIFALIACLELFVTNT